jgi:hypothetical protein
MGAKGVFLTVKPEIAGTLSAAGTIKSLMRARTTSDWPVELFPQLQVGDGDPNSGGLV